MDIRTVLVLILVRIALIGAYSIYSPFILPMIVATLFAMATGNLTKDISNILQSQRLATFVMVTLLIMMVLAPIIYVATVGVDYFKNFDKDSIEISVQKIKELISNIPNLNNWADKHLKVEKILPYFKEISLFFTNIGTKGLGFVKNIFFVIIFYGVIVYCHKDFLRYLR